MNSAIVVGGTNMSEQRGDLRAGVEIGGATPGRLIEHLQQVGTSLSGWMQPCLADHPALADYAADGDAARLLHS